MNYSSEFTQKFRTKIRKKYNFICQLCCKNGWHVHHIDYDKQNCKEENFTVLCKSCHSKTNTSRTYWTNYFIELTGGVRNGNSINNSGK